ncbi:MAG: glycosyltransferase family 4 protein, partial [Planctomycetota bacterium]
FLPTIGGAEIGTHSLAKQWCREGHEVCVFNTVSDVATHPEASYSVRKYYLLRGSHRFGYRRFPFGWYTVRQLSGLLREFKPEFIPAIYGYPTGVWLSRIKPMPKYVITCVGGELTTLDHGFRTVYGIDSILVDALNKSATVISISSYARKVMIEMGVEPAKIVDIPFGVDVEKFQKQIDIDMRAKLDIPENAVLILSVGREHRAKAFNIAVQAFSRMANKVPQAYYVIVGKGTGKWQPLGEQLGIGKRIKFCHWLEDDELFAIYQQSDIFFSASVSELLPLVVMEALAAGLPQVVTNISGNQDMVDTEYNGIIVEPGQIDKMADALQRLATDEGLRKKMGAASLERSTHYGWETISKKYLELSSN